MRVTGWAPVPVTTVELPADVVTVQCDPLVMRLLYLRAIWGLEAGGDPPPALVRPVVTFDAERRRIVGAVLENEWLQAWSTMWKWNSASYLDVDLSEPDALPSLEPERWFHGSSPDGFVVEEFRSWVHKNVFCSPATREATPALASAVGRGLRGIYILPVRGSYAVRMQDCILALSPESSESATQLSAALDSF